MSLSAELSDLGERIFAGRWIAGPRIEDALKRAKKLNEREMSAIINYMGEDFRDERDVAEAVRTDLRLAREIASERINASVSLKITQLGLRISRQLAEKNYRKIVSLARRRRVFVWLDAESHDTIDDAISIYESEVKRGGVGIAVQSYLRRSEKNMQMLLRRNAAIRLVKGAYKEEERIAFRSRKERTKNYAMLMRQLFKRAGAFTLATHDPQLLEEALELEKRSRAKVTYAMLNGIRNGYAAKLAEEGHRIAIYVPFGTRWIEFSLRRMREASHLMLVLRSLLSDR